MKRSVIGIAVVSFLMLAGSVAYAQPGPGRNGDGQDWQQDRRDGRDGPGQDRRNDVRDRQDGRRDRQNASADAHRSNGPGHDGRARPAPTPAPAPAPRVVPPTTTPQNPGVHARTGHDRQAAAERLAAIRAELQLHSQRMASLTQIRALAVRTGNSGAVTLVDTLIAQENIRHRRQMSSLNAPSAPMAHR